LNRIDEAIAEGRLAIDLAPSDPRTHLSLGLALIRAGQKNEARPELKKAIELAKHQPVFRNVEIRAELEFDRLN
jgi:Flp pilus assembly protein TadD